MPRTYLLIVAALAVLAAVLFPIGARQFRAAQEHQKTDAVNQESFVDNDGDGLDDNFEMQCAQRWKPIVYLHSTETFGPSAVENYLNTCVLRSTGSCSWSSLMEGEANAKKKKGPYGAGSSLAEDARASHARSNASTTRRFAVDQRVQTQWTAAEGGDDQWYGGVVVMLVGDDEITIQYDDGDVWTGQEQYARASWEQVGPDMHQYKVGDRCETQWTRAEGGDDQWYSGLVTHLSGTQTITIQYDDGSTWTGEEKYCLHRFYHFDGSWNEGQKPNHGYCKASTSISFRLGKCGWRDPDHSHGKPTATSLGAVKGGQYYIRCLNTNGHTSDNMANGRAEGAGVHGGMNLYNVPYYIHVLPDNRFGGNAVQIQYWFFYPLNGPTIGLGTHQGDWEHFSVIVDQSCSNRLQYKAFAHGGGEKWEQENSGAAAKENGKLVIYSAVNSHATYLSEGKHQGGTKITHDYTDKGDRWYPDFLVNLGETTCSGGGKKPMPGTEFVDYDSVWGTASAFDGVLSENFGDLESLCPSGPHFSYNKDTPYESACRR